MRRRSWRDDVLLEMCSINVRLSLRTLKTAAEVTVDLVLALEEKAP
jgi:hypothetical protein